MTLYAAFRPVRPQRPTHARKRATMRFRAGEKSCNQRLRLAAKKPQPRLHCSQQFSTVALTTSSATIAERYAYSAYGAPTVCNASGTDIGASAKDNRITYTGREWDDDLLLYHFRARLYDAGVGRFSTKDPEGYWASPWNLFQYCSGTALNYTDPSGRVAEAVTTSTLTQEDARACCWKQWRESYHKTSIRGWVMCCKCEHILCSAVKNHKELPQTVIDIFHECNFEHELTHISDVNECDPNNCEKQCYLSLWKKTLSHKERDQEECKGYIAQIKCLMDRYERCGTDAINCKPRIAEMIAHLKITAINDYNCNETDLPSWPERQE